MITDPKFPKKNSAECESQAVAANIFDMRAPIESPRFLNIKEAAKYLRVSVSTLYGWVHRRVVPFRKHGARLAFCPHALDAWSKSHEISVLESAEIHFEKRYGAASYPAKPAKRSLKTEQKFAEATTPQRRGSHGSKQK